MVGSPVQFAPLAMVLGHQLMMKSITYQGLQTSETDTVILHQGPTSTSIFLCLCIVCTVVCIILVSRGEEARSSGNTTHQTGEKSQKFDLFLCYEQVDTQEIIKCRPTNHKTIIRYFLDN